MISKMTRYSFILLSGEKEGFIEALQETGLVDITRSEKPVDETSAKLSGEIDLLNGIKRGLGNIPVPEETPETDPDGEDLIVQASDALMDYSETIDRIKLLKAKRDALAAWGAFDPSTLDRLREAGVPIHFHEVRRKAFRPEWASECALSVISENKSLVRFVVAGEDSLPGEIAQPEGELHAAEQELQEAKERLGHIMSRIAGLKKQLPLLEQQEAEAYAKLDGYLAGSAAVPAAENTIVTYTGYALTDNDAILREKLDKLDVFYLAEPASVEDAPPVALKNNRFVRMFEVLTDMYGRPSYDGFDPTPFLSIFFLLFFAMCMGDAGYGLVLIIAGVLLLKVKSFKDVAPLVVTLGVATTVVGFFFHTFFSIDISKWAVFAPIKGIFLPAQIAGYDGAMVLSLVVGVLHLCLAMIVKTVQATRNHGFLASLGTWGWTLLIVGGVAVGAFALAGVLDASLTKWILIGLGAVSALGIFIFNTPGRNPLLNIGSGLWDTYNTATGLLGDVLSYLRLYALGLAGAMLGYAFNDLGKMVLGDGSGAAGWIGFILIVVVGHTLNIAMCALGAFVHPLRLNFLEFFKNSGYEGNGRNFRPLTNK